MMMRHSWLLTLLACAALGLATAAWAVEADTRLVLTSGMEVRGVLHGLAEGVYDVELPDGRHLQIAQAEVERIERLDAPAATPSAPAPAPVEPPLAEVCHGSILVTETVVDPSFYTAIAKVKDQKSVRGENSEMYPRLADMARTAHADAVVDVRVWKAMGAWAPDVPHATGTLVRWTDKARTTPLSVRVRCY